MGQTEVSDAEVVEVIDGEAVDADEPGVEVVAPDKAVTEARNLPAVRAHDAVITRDEISVEDVVAQRDKIKQVMAKAMLPDVHYGTIPGTKGKPTLLKPGAETICVTFRLAPHYDSQRIFHDDGHLTVITSVRLEHIASGLTIATGEGLCTSREEKYAFRGGSRLCPSCGTANIKRSKFPPRASDYAGADPSHEPGWYCFAKTGGCGAQFAATDPAITSQSEEKQPNPNLADTWNTVMKMANKRALVAAVLNGTAASDIFTQDVEDFAGGGDPAETAAAATPAGASQPARRSGGSRPAGNATAAPTASAAKPPESQDKPKAGGRKPSERALGKMNALRGKLVKAGVFNDEIWHKALERDFGLKSSTEMNAQQVSTMIQRLELAEGHLTDEQKARLDG